MKYLYLDQKGRPVPVSRVKSKPTCPSAKTITKADVWGQPGDERQPRFDWGMIVSAGGQRCGIFQDIVPAKAVTVLVYDEKLTEEVKYWLEVVHGAGCVTGEQIAWTNSDGSRVIALRSEYKG